MHGLAERDQNLRTPLKEMHKQTGAPRCMNKSVQLRMDSVRSVVLYVVIVIGVEVSFHINECERNRSGYVHSILKRKYAWTHQNGKCMCMSTMY